MTFNELVLAWARYKIREHDLERQRADALKVFLSDVKRYKESGGKKFGLSKVIGDRNWHRVKDMWERADEVR